MAEDKYLVADQVKIMVSVNGKVRDELIINNEELIIKEELIERAKKLEKMQKWLEGKQIIKEIYIPSKMINFVTLN